MSQKTAGLTSQVGRFQQWRRVAKLLQQRWTAQLGSSLSAGQPVASDLACQHMMVSAGSKSVTVEF